MRWRVEGGLESSEKLVVEVGTVDEHLCDVVEDHHLPKTEDLRTRELG